MSRALPLAVACATVVSAAAAQKPAQATAAAPPAAAGSPAVGDVAPDFSLPGATRYGLLRELVRLSDYRGQTVVLAFFFKARTKG
jgi:peroxiredoxin Q/BCP